MCALRRKSFDNNKTIQLLKCQKQDQNCRQNKMIQSICRCVHMAGYHMCKITSSSTFVKTNEITLSYRTNWKTILSLQWKFLFFFFSNEVLCRIKSRINAISQKTNFQSRYEFSIKCWTNLCYVLLWLKMKNTKKKKRMADCQFGSLLFLRICNACSGRQGLQMPFPLNYFLYLNYFNML